MLYSTNNEKLTKYLDELADEYKELLLKRLLENTNDMEDISISELIRIDSKIKESLIENKTREIRKQKLLLAMGLVYISLGIFLYVLIKASQSDFIDIPSLISILVTYIGILITVIAFFVPYLNKNKLYNKSINKINDKTNNKIIEYEVIMTWRELEGIANDLSNNYNMKPILPGKIIQMFLQEKLITIEEANSLKELLNLRNNIVHSNQYNFSNKDIIVLIDKAQNITNKLRNIL